MILEPGCKAPLDMLVEKEGQREGEEKQSIQSSYIRSALSTQRLASQIELCVQALFFFFFHSCPAHASMRNRRGHGERERVRRMHGHRTLQEKCPIGLVSPITNRQSQFTVHRSQVTASSPRPLFDLSLLLALRCAASRPRITDSGRADHRVRDPRPSKLEARLEPETRESAYAYRHVERPLRA